MTSVVICGGGYAGIQAALELDRLTLGVKGTTITLIDKSASHILLPSLPELIMKRGFHQISYNDIFCKKTGVKFIQSAIKRIDLEKKQVATTAKGLVNYDILVIALGGRPFLPDNIPGLKEFAYQFNDIDDVQKIISRLSVVGNNDTILVAGGGATGVEVAGEISAHLETTKKQNRAKIILVSASLLEGFPSKSRLLAKSYLQSIGVNLLIGPEFRVSGVNQSSVFLQNGQTIKTDFVIWSGGVKASPLPKEIGMKTGDKDRVIVNQYLQSIDRQDVFVIGDCALIFDNNNSDKPMPTNAQFAEQQGKLAAENIYAMLTGRSMKKYTPLFEGFAVSIGPSFAVASIGTLDLYGSMASNLKKLIKLKYLKEIAGVSIAAKDYASSRF